MSPLFFPHQGLQSQSMFPQLVGSAEQQALVQAFVQQANAEHSMLDSTRAQRPRGTGSIDTLLKSSNSSSMVDSTSDDECTAPENLQMNCISSLGGGPMSPVLQANLLDRTASTGTSLMNAKDFFRMESPGGPLSPNALPRGESEDSLAGAEAVATFKRRLLEEDESEWLDQIHGARAKMAKVGVETFPLQQEPVDMAPFSDVPALTTIASVMPASSPFLQEAVGGAGNPSVDMDKLASMRAILFRHASQPVPSLEEIASTRPKRRNVRISKDPQSVAARLRRERISDRIRVLQRLVPGGTKMDTASMLDEAIHYVKFLKLQLQTLEQIGNNSNNDDPRGLVQQQPPSQLSSLVRPFDLNCTQAWPAPPTSMVNNLHHSQASLRQGLSTLWPSDANNAFSDAMQEQFCH
ncbi:hypothetical protein M758_1G182100 [Ceratodon purpureus]|nr:hypothetical protein M758_1G182100 [Ceratodon purpureus]